LGHLYEIIFLLSKFAWRSLKKEIYIYVYISFPVGHRLLGFIRHSCRWIASL